MKTINLFTLSVLLLLSQIADAQKIKPVGSVDIGASPTSLTFTPNGEMIYVGTSDKQLYKVSLDELKVVERKAMPDNMIGVKFSPDGKYFGYIGKKLYVSDSELSRVISTSKKSGMNSFSFVGEAEEAVVTFPQAGKVMIYDNNSQAVLHKFDNIYSYDIWKYVDVSHDGKMFLVVNNTDIFVYDYIAKGNLIRRFRKPTDKTKSWHKAEFSPDNSIVLALVGMKSKYPSIEIYDLESEQKIGAQPVSNINNKSGDIDFAVSPDGNTLAVCNYRDELIRLWDISSLYAETEMHKAILAEKEKKEAEEAAKQEKSIDNTQLETIMAKIDALNAAAELPGNEAVQSICKEVDLDIPESGIEHPFRFALVIGNEDYSSYQSGLESEVDVDYAVNDAKVFKEYATKVLGVPSGNVTYMENATAGQMNQAISKMNKIIEFSEGKAEVFFYYSGHGLPDENTKESYIMPVDVSGFTLQYAIKVDDIYKKLTEHPSKRVTVFMDACFSGGARNAGLVAVKGVKIVPKAGAIKGSLVIFTSSTGDESSQVYKQKYHGMFTYHLLKKLKETKGNITYRELSDYLNQSVKLQSVIENNKVQTPTTNVSSEVKDSWGEWVVK